MPKRVLLADDSTTIQRVVELALASDEVAVSAVPDGERAIAAIVQATPDLVLADISMPHRTGYEVAEWMRAQPQLAAVPVLLLAGAFEAVDPDRVRTAGADGVLTKPLDPAVLVDTVQGLLAAGRSLVSTQPAAPAPPEMRPVGPDAGILQPRSAPSADADLYFEEIDRAFAQLARQPKPAPLPAPDADLEQELTTYLAPVTPTHVPAPSGGPLGDAFATLLDAERTGAVVLPLGRIALAPPPQATPAIDTNALADQIARRVLAQLSDRVIRETVADLVSTTAERLVREEIDRIKRNIK